MKKIFALLIVFVMVMLIGTFTAFADDYVTIDESTFPDAIFRSRISLGYDNNGDGKLSTTERAITALDISNADITNLKGIEYFTSLTELNINNTKVSSLDLTTLTGLKILRCATTPISSLDLVGLTSLEELYCSYTQLSTLNVSMCPNLKTLEFRGCNISNLNLSNNAQLESLVCESNDLTVLDLSANTELKVLDCMYNKLTSLDLSDCENINTIYFFGNSYPITVGDDRKFNLNDLPGNFDPEKSSNWIGGTVENGILTIDEGTEKVSYDYQYRNDPTVIAGFELIIETLEDEGIRIVRRGEPTKGYKEDVVDEYAIPLPDTRGPATPEEEANPNTGLALSALPLIALALLFKKR